jgi:hypothetical protein
LRPSFRGDYACPCRGRCGKELGFPVALSCLWPGFKRCRITRSSLVLPTRPDALAGKASVRNVDAAFRWCHLPGQAFDRLACGLQARIGDINGNRTAGRYDEAAPAGLGDGVLDLARDLLRQARAQGGEFVNPAGQTARKSLPGVSKSRRSPAVMPVNDLHRVVG